MSFFKDIDKMALSGVMNDDAEMIPLITSDEDDEELTDLPDELPLLPLRNTVLFPGVVIPITVGRDKSIKLIGEAYKGNRIIGVTAQKDMNVEEPVFEDLHTTGTIARILKMLKMPDGSTTAIIQGKKRMRLEQLTQTEPFLKTKYTELAEIKPDAKNDEFQAVFSALKESALQIIELSPEIPSEAAFAIKNIESPSFLINFVSGNMNAPVEEKQAILEITDPIERATQILKSLQQDLQMQELKNKIRSKVKVDIDKQQKEYFLHQQLRQIQEELGTGTNKDIEELKAKAESKNWSGEAKEVFEKEIGKLERTNPASPEYSVIMNYLELMTDLPWSEYSKDNFDLVRAKKILDRDHFGIKKVKERLLEYLAVLKLKGDMRSPILCLVGPPGVGKTSLGKSVAEALGRKYVRMALGGMKDESEIRGHRKTYIGAMPGRVLQNIKKVKTSNPVFILDELDKLGTGFHGDPSSALLEVLDPEQNTTFHDNFLEVEYDLSKVLFIATANSLSTIQPALLDRMEIIELSGYSMEEKVEIAKRHLVPKQLKEHGLEKSRLSFSKKVLEFIIENYTRESGVRNLEREIARVIRNKAKAIAMDENPSKQIEMDELETILGPAHPKAKYIGNEYPGVVTGLAWTSVGGDILYIESSVTPGKGKLTLTGNLGDVMKESAVIALEYLKSRSQEFGLQYDVFSHTDVHVHVPEGATPKDGPSAGITMFTSLVSAYTQRKIKSQLAMTGEITLRGEVLPVGGIKEKILAAKRAGIKYVILSEKNQKDVNEIEPEYIIGLEFHYVKNMSDVASFALLKEKVKNPRDFSQLISKSNKN
ncbi:MAG: endopeptidase La [Flavobacteriales bacterium]|nr:endopeptidase La [Flavobacteriales bacterium]